MDAPRIRVRLRGAVQGVGMRPYVHRLAAEHGLTGFVANGGDGVTIEAEGTGLPDFLRRLTEAPPPLARIDAIDMEHLPGQGGHGFAIATSTAGPVATAPIPDAATCEACRRDLFDPASRFHCYPFVTCTECGPRFTITHRLPYDRARTAMARFPLCADCRRDYRDPASRRHHAEAIACPACGPRLSHPVASIAAAVQAGRIVALQGIGGFHLLCDARTESAVARLRHRKRRGARPFAVMVANAQAIAAFAVVTPAERTLLEGWARPIVLVECKAVEPARPLPLWEGAAVRSSLLAPSVAPNLRHLGVLLAYTPVHHLLFGALPPGTALVATSANSGGAPMLTDPDTARRSLSGLADLIVTHNRPILHRADDALMHIVAGAPAVLRLGRGVVPDPIALAEDGPDTLALGAQQKTTVAVTRGREAFVSAHIGGLDHPDTLRAWHETIAMLLRVLDIRPDRTACDRHPDYASSRFAEDFGLTVVRVQHHAAHIAAVAAEHGLTGPALGLALDGHGMGDDGAAWGGEMMLVHGSHGRRIGGLATLPLPGGDRAAREPWRMGVAALHALGLGHTAAARFPDQPLAAALAARLDRAPGTSSLGRLFDAAAALLGLRRVQDDEGQAAMELEALAAAPRALPGGWQWRDGALCFRPLLRTLLDPALDRTEAAGLFHGTLIDGLAALAAQGAAETGITTICLGGGCLMNRILAEGLIQALPTRGLTPLWNRRVPANDGGIALGQALLARGAVLEN